MTSRAAHSPLVLLHGFLGRPAAWDAVRAELGVVEVLVPPLPGHGPAPSPVGASFIDSVEVLLATLPERFWLAGYSMGARLALAIAVLHPERVRGALLVGADVGIRDDDARAARRQVDSKLAARLEANGVEEFAAWWEALPLFASQDGLPPALLARQRRWRAEHTAYGLAAVLRRLAPGTMPPFWDSLGTCQVPLRFLAGALDEKFVAIGREAALTAPRATFRAVDGAGHNLLLERPDEVAAEIRNMLARESR